VHHRDIKVIFTVEHQRVCIKVMKIMIEITIEKRTDINRRIMTGERIIIIDMIIKEIDKIGAEIEDQEEQAVEIIRIQKDRIETHQQIDTILIIAK
jgi:hypothetical protein